MIKFFLIYISIGLIYSSGLVKALEKDLKRPMVWDAAAVLITILFTAMWPLLVISSLVSCLLKISNK